MTLYSCFADRARRFVAIAAIGGAGIALLAFPARAQNAQACIEGPLFSYSVCNTGNGNEGNNVGYTTSAGPFKVAGASEGDIADGGYYFSNAEANLPDGILRTSILFQYGGSSAGMGSLAYFSDLLTFHGSGSATLSAHVSGMFLGSPSASSPDQFEFRMFAYRSIDGEFAGPSNSSISMFNRNMSLNPIQVVTTACNHSTSPISINGCSVTQTDIAAYDADIWQTFTGLVDGEQILFFANAESLAYGQNHGGVDFVSVLDLTVGEGMSYSSESGEFFTSEEATTAPEPSSMLLVASGFALLCVGCVRRSRRTASLS